MSNKTKGKAQKTLAKALDELQQELAAIQVLGRALTDNEKARLKVLRKAIDLVTRALEAIG